MKTNRLWPGAAIVMVSAALAGCEPQGSTGTPRSAPAASSAPQGPQGGLAPAPGRTESERQARRDYYQGPRGDEF